MKKTEHRMGWWWLPGAEDKRVPGALEIDEDGARLTIFGQLGDPFSSMIPIVLGNMDGGVATLHGLAQRKGSLGFTGAPSHQVYSVLRAYKGIQTASPESTVVQRNWFRLQHLREWLEQGWIRLNYADDFHWLQAIRTTPPKQEHELSDGTRLRFTFDSGFGVKHPMVEFHLTSGAQVVLEYPQPKELQVAQHDWMPWAALLYLAAMRPCHLLAEGYVDVAGTPITSMTVGKGISEGSALDEREFMFMPKDMTPSFGQALSAWHEFAMTGKSILEAFLAYVEGGLLHIQAFLVLTQALDGYGTLRANGTKRTKVQLKELDAKLAGAVDDADRTDLMRLASTFNGFSFRVRLESLLTTYAPHMGLTADQVQITAKQVVATRNFHTHTGQKKDGDVQDGAAFQQLTNLAFVLLRLCLASEAKVDDVLLRKWAKQQVEGFSTFVLPGH